MIKWDSPPYLGPQPPMGPSSVWGSRPRTLRHDQELVRFSPGYWVAVGQPLTPLQSAAVTCRALEKPGTDLALTGLSALAIYNLLRGRTVRGMDSLLGHKAPPELGEEHSWSQLTYLSWTGRRRRTDLPAVKLSKGAGLPTFPGPWGSRLVHPVEALVKASPVLQQWRITAALDHLMAHHLVFKELPVVEAFTRAELHGALDKFPPTSRPAQRCRAALAAAQGNTWSATETLMRLMVVAAGLPAPRMNLPVTVEGKTYFLDAAWEQEKVALEYNGRGHLQMSQYGDEMYRRHRLEDMGWKIRYIVWADLVDTNRRRTWLGWLASQLSTQQKRQI